MSFLSGGLPPAISGSDVFCGKPLAKDAAPVPPSSVGIVFLSPFTAKGDGKKFGCAMSITPYPMRHAKPTLYVPAADAMTVVPPAATPATFVA